MKFNYLGIAVPILCFVFSLYTFNEKKKIAAEKNMLSERLSLMKEDEELNYELVGRKIFLEKNDFINQLETFPINREYILVVFFSMKHCNSCVQSEIEMIENKLEKSNIDILYIANTEEYGLAKRFALLNHLKYKVLEDNFGQITNKVFSKEVSFVKVFLVNGKVAYCQTASPQNIERSYKFIEKILKFSE